MPATDTYWRSLKKMHVAFVLSAIGLFAVTIGMMWKDHHDEWRAYQDAFDRIEEFRLTRQIDENLTESYDLRVEELQSQLQTAQAAYDGEKDEIVTEIESISYQLGQAERAMRERRAFRDVARANYDLAIRDELEKEAKVLKEKFDAEQEKVAGAELLVEQLTTDLDTAKAKQQKMLDDVTKIENELKLVQSEVARLESTKEKIAPDSWFSSAKRTVMQWPIIDGFNSPRQIKQVWLPDLKITLGMAQTARFDRCQTCHLGIDRVESGNLPTFPHSDEIAATEHPTDKEITEWIEKNEYPHPYSTHPNPELFLTSTSPHPTQEFGCTICHDGQGSGTSFDNVQHTPNDPHQHEEWEEKYHYHPNHFWEYPMLPDRFRESSCLKCHHSVVELETSPKFGNSAPKLVKGFHTIEQYGCFGCHEMHGQDGGNSIGPDMRLEPNYYAVAQAISAAVGEVEDPTDRLLEIQTLANEVADHPEETSSERAELRELVTADGGLETPALDSRIHALAEDLKDNENPGKYRKVGPGLRHVAEKTTRGWLEYWTEMPKRFRPSTRMPQFFQLSNQDDEKAEDYQPVQIAAITHYLLEKSQPFEADTPPEGYKANAERGKDLFSKRGCLACHSHKDFPDIQMDFGPNLDKVHEKVKAGDDGFNWLYTWIRNPHKYSKRTKMPNLYLDPYVPVGEKDLVDPAADIAAYLLKERTDEVKYTGYDVKKAAEEKDLVLDEMVSLFLSQALTVKQLEEFEKSRKFPLPAKQIKGDEIELVFSGEGKPSDEEWHSMKLNYVGRRTISTYGCYACHDIPGFEGAKPIGVALQDWGRKDTSRLAFEHITEFLHHHNAPGADVPLTKQVDQAVKRANAEEFKSEEDAEDALSKAFYYDSIMHHGRPGFIWQKLRQPRSYDYKKTETKRYDERLRMPKFPFDEEQIEAVATFVLGMTADPPAKKYLFQTEGATKARYQGEALLTKYNCTSCHIMELPEVAFEIKPRKEADEVVEWFTENRDAIRDGALKRSAYPPVYRQIDDRAKQAGSSIMSLVEETDGKDGAEFEAYLLSWFARNPDVLTSGYADGDYVTDPFTKTQGMTRDQIVDWFSENRDALIEGDLPETMPSDIKLIGELCELFEVGADIPGIAKMAAVDKDSTGRKLSQSEQDTRFRTNLHQWFESHPVTMLVAKPDVTKGKLPAGVRALLKIKPPITGESKMTADNGNAILRFHGTGLEIEGEYSYDTWDTVEVGGRIMLPTTKMLFTSDQLIGIGEGRGGQFTEWLVNDMGGQAPDKLSKARQSAPPPLMLEGLKVQTPWLYSFLKNPETIRNETVLRMPRFNMSDDEALALANYFAAVDDTQYPYQDIPQKKPAYIAKQDRVYEKEFEEDSEDHGDYLARSWHLFAKFDACRQCHAIAGDKFNVADPKQATHGPNLDTRVASRFRPDYLEAWLHGPSWILPYTGMVGPTSKPLDGYFKKDPNVQVEALRDAMLNYNMLIQREGKIEPPALSSPETTETTASE